MAVELYNTAEHLAGRKIGSWNVVEKVSHRPSTGGNFSYGYTVVDENGRQGFLKALDYSEAFRSGASVDLFKAKVDAFVFERNLMNECRSRHLRHVVTIIDSNRYEIPEEQQPEGKFCVPVDYLVLEKADKSIRDMIDLSQSFDIAWMLRSLHNVAVGIEELHGAQIAHQDIKPSNVLVFQNQAVTKIGDIGRSISFIHPSEQDSYPHAGDYHYAPPELLYGEIITDQKKRRYSCDMYMFGNLIYTYFNNISLTTAILYCLQDDSRPKNWKETYKSLMPQIESAFARCLESFNKGLPDELRSELISLVQQLCAPDVERRGDVSRSHLGVMQYSLQKYITRLDVLARQYEYRLKRVML